MATIILKDMKRMNNDQVQHKKWKCHPRILMVNY